MVKPTRFSILFFKAISPFLFVAVLLISSSSFSNEPDNGKTSKLITRAREAIATNRYSDAEALIYKAIRADSSNIIAQLLLSDISDELSKPAQQKAALGNVIRLDSVNYPLAYKLYGALCFKEGDYENAKKSYQRYQQLMPSADSSFVSLRIASSSFAIESIKENRNVVISNPGENINTALNEYWPAIATNDSVLYFTRLINKEPHFVYERIFVSERNEQGWGEAAQLVLTENENVNIGTMCISSDGKLLFYTACGQHDGYGSCDIYYSRKHDSGWSKPVNAGSILNTSSWEAQPSVSSDNHYLYFSSNRSGGHGGMDIWRCDMAEMKNGSLFFSNPRNLGRNINSAQNDFSPFIHADGATLYYSSEGKYGFGGSDIFISRLKDTIWSEPNNLGFPINSRSNDDGLVVSPTAKIAFFSSNRAGTSAQSKDLFQIELPSDFLPEKVGYLAGKVYDLQSGKCIEAIIKITLIENGNSKTVISAIADGYITTLNAGQLYALHVEKEGYLFYSRHFNLKATSTFSMAEEFDIFLDPVTVGKRFVLANVFFDFDSDVLKNASTDELQKLTTFLRNNQRLKVEISGHTDAIGDMNYNLILSEKRAKAIYNYLLPFIDSMRLTYTGYGATLPIATNETEEGRIQNRRCEIKILEN